MSTQTEPRPYRRGPLKTLWPSPATPTSRRAARKADPEYGVPAVPSWRDVDWKAHLHLDEILGAPVQYVDIGEGDRVVVFVHGLWMTGLESFALRHHVVHQQGWEWRTFHYHSVAQSQADVAAGRLPGMGLTIDIINGGIECGYARSASVTRTGDGEENGGAARRYATSCRGWSMGPV